MLMVVAPGSSLAQAAGRSGPAGGTMVPGLAGRPPLRCLPCGSFGGVTPDVIRAAQSAQRKRRASRGTSRR